MNNSGNNDRIAELWALFAAHAMAGHSATETMDRILGHYAEIAACAAQRADYLLVEFRKRYPRYTGE